MRNAEFSLWTAGDRRSPLHRRLCVAAHPLCAVTPARRSHGRPSRTGFERVSDARAASGGSSELSESTETSNRAAARVRRLRLRIEDPSRVPQGQRPWVGILKGQRPFSGVRQSPSVLQFRTGRCLPRSLRSANSQHRRSGCAAAGRRLPSRLCSCRRSRCPR